jgi:membrane protease YdiL (CAAX protease family)
MTSLMIGGLSILIGLIFWIFLPKGEFKRLWAKSKDSGFAPYALGFSALSLNIGITSVISHFFPETNSSQSQDLLNLMNDTVGKVLVFVLVVLLKPVFEEILFRGFLIDGFRKFLKRKPPFDVVLSAIFFGLSHGVNHFPGGFLFAFCLGMMRVRSGSLRRNFKVHALNNAFGLTMLYFNAPTLNLTLSIILSVLGLFALARTLSSCSALSDLQK